MPQTEFAIASATPIKLEAELRALPFDQAGLSVYDNGSGGARVIYARTLTNDESQEVEQALGLHVTSAGLPNYIELIAAAEGSAPRIQSNSSRMDILTNGGNGIKLRSDLNTDFLNVLGSVGFQLFFSTVVANYLVYNAGAGSPRFDAVGTSTDININFVPKNAGRLQENGSPVSTDANPPSMGRTFMMMGA
jgi:hypothetical protein